MEWLRAFSVRTWPLPLATTAVCVLCGSCGAPAAEGDGARAPQAARSCGAAAETQKREVAWGQLQAVVRAHASQRAMDAAVACETARGLLLQCPGWDPSTGATQRAACQIALAEDMNELEESLVMTLNPSPLTEPLEGDPWISGAPRTFAASLARFEALAPHSPEEAKVLAAAQGLRRDSLRYGSDVQRLHSSCADIDELEQAMRAVGPFTAQRYERTVEIRRNTEVELRQRRVRAVLAKEYPAADAATAMRDDLELARKLASDLHCYSAEASKLADADIARWVAKVETEVAARKHPPR